jgi:hypothetical protein
MTPNGPAFRVTPQFARIPEDRLTFNFGCCRRKGPAARAGGTSARAAGRVEIVSLRRRDGSGRQVRSSLCVRIEFRLA